MRILDGEQKLVRIFIGDVDKWHHVPLHRALLERLRKEGFAGATVIHGVAGFGAASVIHTSSIVDLSADLPVLIEVVDDAEYIDKLIPILDEMITKGALVTIENVRVLKYAAGEPKIVADPLRAGVNANPMISDRLATLADIAGRLGESGIASDARALRERLAGGRVFVACVGQFKRGKSSLLNALVGEPVLPVGVVPVTAVVTVVRFGARHARARLRDADWAPIELDAVRGLVSESENPDNAKGVVAVEIFVPYEPLRSGLCLVDTPGLGSVHASNTAATREFIPQIDAALVVLGADPPISGEELDLVAAVSKDVRHVLFALNKADKVSDAEMHEAQEFTAGVLRKQLGKDPGRLFIVSAAERQARGASRDWPALEDALVELARAGADMTIDAEARGARRFAARLLQLVEEERLALLRPQQESASRVETLERAVEDAERTLVELSYLFRAVSDDLAKTLEAERRQFMKSAVPEAHAKLELAIDGSADRADLPSHAMTLAQTIARDEVEAWRRANMPVVEAGYAKSARRLASIAADFLRRVADPSDPALASLPETFDTNVRIRTKPRFFFTEMLTIASPPLASRIGLTRSARVSAAKKGAGEYLDRLLETNGTRAASDFTEQVSESARRMQTELRDHLRGLVGSARTAADRANERRARGEDAVQRAVLECQTIRDEILRLGA